MNRCTKLLEDWQNTLVIAPVSALFIRVIYFVIAWSLIKSLPVAHIIWGPDYLSHLFNPYTNFDRFAMLLNVPEIRIYYQWFLWPAIALSVAGVFGFHPIWGRMVLWYLFTVLQYGNIETSTGGHHLMQQVLFFHIFLIRVEEASNGLLPRVCRFIHHLAFYSIWLEISMMYLVAGAWKMTGTYWMSGDALLLSLSFKEFGSQWVSDHMQSNNWFFMLSNYIVLAYQLLFAVLIWIKRIRKPFLVIGMIFHLSIAIIVSLMDFGLYMLALYSVYITPTFAENLLVRIRWLSTGNLKKLAISTEHPK